MKSRWHDSAWSNIKGTPSMPAWKVAGDLRKIKKASSVFGVVEFRWPWYWRKAADILSRRPRKGAKWGSFPNFAAGLAKPVAGAQCIFWRRSLWKRLDTAQGILHEGHAGISESRSLRASLLTDRESGLSCWFGTTHFVVGGDEAGDGPLRQKILDEDIARLDAFLTRLQKSGYPIIFGLDANIHRRSQTYRDFIRMLDSHDATIHGEHGVEYVFVIQGTVNQVETGNPSRITPADLHTDHEVRILPFRLSSVQ